MTNISLTSYVLVAIMLVALFFGVYSFGLPNIKARVVPIIASSFIFILAAIELVRELRLSRGKKEDSLQKSQAPETDLPGERRRFVALFAWMLGFFAAVYILGFAIGIFLFVSLFLKSHGKGWITSISSAVVTAGAIYLLFVVILEMPLFEGIAFEGFSIEHWIHSGRKSL